MQDFHLIFLFNILDRAKSETNLEASRSMFPLESRTQEFQEYWSVSRRNEPTLIVFQSNLTFDIFVTPARAMHSAFSRHFLGHYFSFSSGCELLSTPTLPDLSTKNALLPRQHPRSGGHAQRTKPDIYSSTVEYDRVKQRKTTTKIDRHDETPRRLLI